MNELCPVLFATGVGGALFAVSRNVAFRTEHGTQIRRALVVRRQFLQ